MQTSLRLKLWLGIPVLFLLLIIALPFASVIIPPMFGYYVEFNDAKNAAVANNDVNECNKLVQFFSILSPPQAEQRQGCIYTVAQLTNDPRICIRLMPSSYGISCIGEMWGKVSEYTHCFDKGDVPDLKDGELQCVSYDIKTDKGTIMRTKDCMNLTIPIQRDQCNTALGGQYGDTAYCNKIENPVLKSVCEVRIELQKKYPEIPELR